MISVYVCQENLYLSVLVRIIIYRIYCFFFHMYMSGKYTAVVWNVEENI